MKQGSECGKYGPWMQVIPALEAAKTRNDSLNIESGIINQLIVAANNFKNQALGTTRNRVFLQPRYVGIPYSSRNQGVHSVALRWG